MSRMNLYCTGGAGTNIGRHFSKYAHNKDPGFAELVTYFVDTSKSNLHQDIPEDRIYLVDGLDGSGKRRDANYEPLSERSKEILHKFKPADINVVLHSAGGGTGSTIGPILVSELLSRDENVIVMMIGSTSSRKETENTIASLQSYESISQRRGKPVNLHYRENTVSTPRGRIDTELQTAIVMLASVYSGSNRELDSADLSNFLNYHKVTTYQPRLSFLDFFSKEVQVGKGQALISLVTLVDNDTSSDIATPVEYQSVGFLPDTTRSLIPADLPIHICVISGYFNTVMDALKLRASEFEEARGVVIDKPIIGPDQQTTKDGLVF